MKKIFKIILRSILGLIVLASLILLMSHLWISTRWKTYYTESEIKTIADDVRGSKVLSDNFYTAYDQLYPNQRRKTLSEHNVLILWKIFFGSKKISDTGNCSCEFASRIIIREHAIGGEDYLSFKTAYGLEKFTTEEKCFDYYYGKQKITQLSIDFFGKDSKELSIKENIKLLRILKSPTIHYKRLEQGSLYD